MNEKWPRRRGKKTQKTKRPEDDIVAGFEDRDRGQEARNTGALTL